VLSFDIRGVLLDVKSVLEQPTVKKKVKILLDQGSKLLENLLKRRKSNYRRESTCPA